jgi:hypothetical protein
LLPGSYFWLNQTSGQQILNVMKFKRQYPFLLFVLATILSQGCTSPSNQKITGSWSVIKNDSIYDEFIFSGNNFYTYDEKTGDVFGHYKVSSDSISLSGSSGIIESKIEWIDADNFVVYNNEYKGKFTRLKIPIIPSKIFSRDDAYCDSYIQSFIHRKRGWERRL